MTQDLIVPFHEEQIRIIVADDGTEYVPLKPLVDALGLSWEASRRRLLTQKTRWGTVILDAPTYRTVGGSAGPEREMTCIPRVRVGGWLHSVDTNKVKPEARDRLIRYQQELDVVIDRYLTGQHSAELAELRGQVGKLRAYALAFNPFWAKIFNLQQAGVWENMVRHHVKKPMMEVADAINQMRLTGIIDPAEWADYKAMLAEETAAIAERE